MGGADELSKVGCDVVLQKIKKLFSVATQLKEIVEKEVALDVMCLGHPRHRVNAILDIRPVICPQVIP